MEAPLKRLPAAANSSSLSEETSARTPSIDLNTGVDLLDVNVYLSFLATLAASDGGGGGPGWTRNPRPPFEGWSHLAAAGTAAGHRSASITPRRGTGVKKNLQQLRRSVSEGTEQRTRAEAAGTFSALGISTSLQPHYFFSFLFFPHLKSTDGRVTLLFFFFFFRFNTLLCWRRVSFGCWSSSSFFFFPICEVGPMVGCFFFATANLAGVSKLSVSTRAPPA